MTIRWRLMALVLQIFVLCAATFVVTGSVVRNEIWFFSGLLAIVINPQLLEPYYPKPQDVVGNAIVASALALAASKAVTGPGWTFLLAFLVVVGLAALLAILLGAGKDGNASPAIATGLQTLARVGSAAIIYSSVFWLSAIEFAPPTLLGGVVRFPAEFWTLAGTWAILMMIGRVNWQSIWASVTRAPVPGTPEGMIGPSILLVSSNTLPPSGTVVGIGDTKTEAEGVVITRIQRADDAWAEIYIENAEQCAELLRKPALRIETRQKSGRRIIGAVDSGSSDRRLEFVTTEPLTVGEVVIVREGSHEVLYQVSTAQIDRSAVRGGTHLIVRARAIQLGEFEKQSGRIVRHQWVPTPGNAVERSGSVPAVEYEPSASWMLLGHVVGTKVPVYIDMDTCREGHVVILGMTKMGKTTFAVRLAEGLGGRGSVIVLDQSGEYSGKRALKTFEAGDEDQAGVSVFEPKPGENAPERALKLLKWLVEKAMAEYKAGEPPKRVLILEEAHQFVPEPAGMAFGTQGREQSYEFGILMMQVRKYGLSAVLISQRTAVVAKSALSQCENVIAFKSVDQTRRLPRQGHRS